MKSITSPIRSVGPLFGNLAQSLYQQGLFDQAIQAAETATDTARKLYDPALKHTIGGLADALLVEADIKRHTGFFEQAEDIYEEVIELARDDKEFIRQRAFAKSGLGDIAEERGQTLRTIQHYEEAVRGLSEVSGFEEELAHLRNNLALIHRDEGDFEAAEKHLIAGIQLMEAGIGRYSETVGSLYANLSTLYFRTGHLEQAREVAVLAREIRNQVLPQNHPDIAHSLSNLGAVQHALGDLDGAMVSFKQAVAILEENPEADPQDYEVVVSNYIDLLRESGFDEKADKKAEIARKHYTELKRVRSAEPIPA